MMTVHDHDKLLQTARRQTTPPPPPMARSYNGKHSITSPHVEDHYSARSSVIGMELPSASSTLQESYAAVEKPQATELMIRLAVSSPARWPENIPAQAHGRLRYTKDLGSAPAPSHGCFPSHSPSYPEKKPSGSGPVSPGPVISSIPVTLVATITFTVGATSGLGLALGFAIPFTFSRGKVRWIPWLGRDISSWRRVSHNSNCTLETITKDRIQVISNNSCVVPGELQLFVAKSKTAYTIFSRGNIADKILKGK